MKTATTKTVTLTGIEAIEYAEKHDMLLSKYEDFIESARTNLSIEEADEVAKSDPSLIYIKVEVDESATDGFAVLHCADGCGTDLVGYADTYEEALEIVAEHESGRRGAEICAHEEGSQLAAGYDGIPVEGDDGWVEENWAGKSGYYQILRHLQP